MAPFHQLRGFLCVCVLGFFGNFRGLSINFMGKKEIFHINRFYNPQFSYLLGPSVIGLARDSQTLMNMKITWRDKAFIQIPGIVPSSSG